MLDGSNMSESDIKVTLAVEDGLRQGLATAMAMLDAVGVQYDARHIMSAIMTMFIGSLAVIVKPEHWEGLIDSLKAPEMRAQMEEHAASTGSRLNQLRSTGGDVGLPKKPGALN